MHARVFAVFIFRPGLRPCTITVDMLVFSVCCTNALKTNKKKREQNATGHLFIVFSLREPRLPRLVRFLLGCLVLFIHDLYDGALDTPFEQRVFDVYRHGTVVFED